MNLGRFEINNIYNEDCYKAIKELPDKCIDLVYIDIPYLYEQGGSGSSELGERTARKRIELMGKTELLKTMSARDALKLAKKQDKTQSIEDGIDYSIFDELCRIMKKTYIYIWCSKLQINAIMNYFLSKDCYFEILVWCKSNPTPQTNNSYLPDLEYCLMFREKGTKLNDGYELKSKWYVSPINKGDKDLYEHPTIKPLDLVERHILHSTQPNDIVLDCFLGSGTTAVACKETGRKYIGFEINEKYFKIAQDRLNGITKDGQTTIFTDFEQTELNI